MYLSRFLIIPLILLSCAQKTPETKSPKPEIVGVEQVRSMPVSTIIEVPGTLEARHSALLSFLQGGYLRSAAYDIGGTVQKGDTLASLDTRALEAAHSQALAGLEKARRDLQRAQNLLEGESIAQSTYDDAKTGLQSAEAVYQAAAFALEHGHILAPFSGKIAARLFEPGQIIPPGIPVYQLVNARQLKLTVGVAAKYVSLVDEHAQAYITLPNSDMIPMPAKITGLPAAGNLLEGVVPVKIECPNPHNWLPGVSVRVKIVTQARTEKLIIPPAALRVTSEGETFCYRYRPDSQDVVKTPVQAGSPSEQGIEIFSGLASGDLVVTEGVERVRDGDKVILYRKAAPVYDMEE